MLLLLAGCATQGGGGGPASDDRADRLMRRGDNAGAAAMYEQLAQGNPPPARNNFALAAARAWLAANRADDAQRALDLASGASGSQQLELGMVRSQVAVARGQYAVAWQQVSQLPQPADAATASRLLQLRQQVALRAGQPLDAVRAGITRESLAGNDEQRTAARRDLLTGLRGAIEGGLRVDPATSNDPLVRGWLELAQISVSAGRSPLSADSAVARWRTRFPGHPGSTIIESEILHPASRPSENIPRLVASSGPVALLLPLTGRQSAVAQLVRDGFQAAVARLPESERPALKIYDTGAMSVGAALQAAQAEGAGFIVGPLVREEAQVAAEQRPGTVPLLLLNTLPGTSFAGNQLYQFALSPEDEARQIARQIAGSGKRNVAVLAPTGDWGNRVATAFTEELTHDGGGVVAQGSYDIAKNDLTSSLTATLGINEARARQQRLQQTINAPVEFDAYPRPDIDAIFVAGYQSIALRQINSQLIFNNAGDLPIYITQDGVSADTTENRDLRGMRVLGTPWELDSVGPVADLRTATETQWSAQGPRQSRYFAFGYDAATLTMALRRGSANWPLQGLTGRLQLTPEGRIERSLNWGQLKDGQVQAFDPAAN
ncbi:MAG: penicillin-binding protein activator [Pseudomonadota bacterium]